jgi:DNA-binding NarL/FixJ family response regulator
VIRIAILDDHPALRAGLEAVIRTVPGLGVVGTAAELEEYWPMLERARPDVVLLDYHLPGDDGLVVCRETKSRPDPPRVLLYSAYAGGSLAVPAALAGADGVIGKGLPANELYDAIRRVARGERVSPPLPPELVDDAAARLEEQDLPIFGMALQGTPPEDIADVLGLDRPGLHQRLDRIIRRLRVEVPELDF